MIIYQIHKYSGEYEDFTDDIVSSYLHKETAEIELTKLIHTEELLRKEHTMCDKCVFTWFTNNTDIREKCNKAKFDNEGYCENVDIRLCNCNYEMVEVIVNEN